MKNIGYALLTSALMISTACGGGSVGSKDDAAKASYGVQKTGEDVQGQSAAGLTPAQYLPDGVDENGVSVNDEHTVNGKEGQAIVSTSADVTSGSVETSYKVKYENFTLDGINYLNGEISYTTKVTADGNGAAVTTEMKGTVDLLGDYESNLEEDVTLAVVADANGASVTMNGKVIADGETYEFSGDAFDIETAADSYFSN